MKINRAMGGQHVEDGARTQALLSHPAHNLWIAAQLSLKINERRCALRH
jgi:hypothetical protein